MNNPSNKFINIGYWIPLFLLLLLYTFQSYSFHIHDFANYYYGGYFVTTQSFDSNIYDALHFNESLVNLGFKNLFVSYYPNTPFLSFFYAPFSFLDWQTAKVLFNVLSCLWFCWALFRLFRYFKIDFRYLVLMPVLFFIPIKK